MRIIISILLLLPLRFCNVNQQNGNNEVEIHEQYRMISYNVENLFDTWNDEQTFDDDFTPQGSYRWTRERYQKKINDIGKVIINASKKQNPAIIGLMEVENRAVLEDLLTDSPLKKFQYAIVHEDSPYERGIDVALLYDTNQFEFIDYQIGRVAFPTPIDDKTRDLLIVKGKLAGELIYVVVNHWPSRRGGVSRSEPKRIHVAKMVRDKVQAILKEDEDAGIILMGDFNDTPTNKSLRDVIGARQWRSESDFVNLMMEFERQGKGSYKFRNQWNLLDQFIVSRNLTDTSGKLYIGPNSAKIFSPDWLQQRDQNYPGSRPFRTYLGPRYIGGYSDHFPILLDVYVRRN